jgi:hypothetical protein
MQNCISSLFEGIRSCVREGPAGEEAVAPAGKEAARPPPSVARRAEEGVEEVQEGGGVEPVRSSMKEVEQARRRSPRPTSGEDGRRRALRCRVRCG